MTQHRADFEHNPWILLGAFGGVAVLLFALLKLTGGGADQQAMDTTPTGTPGPAVVATDGPAPAPSPTAAPTAPAHKVITPKATIKPNRSIQQLRAKVQAADKTLTTTGPLGSISVPMGGPVTGSIMTSVANIPNTHADRNWYNAIHALIAPSPDFVTLNEVYKHPTTGIEAAAPGYTAWRVETPDPTLGGPGPSMNNVVMWRTDRWDQLDGGRFKAVNDDNGFLMGKPFIWDRYAMWSILKRKSDGAIVSLVSLHMPTNPVIYPQQHGHPGMSRVAKYNQGMLAVTAMVNQLRRYGPVLLGGDMNSHPGQGGWTAAAHMGADGFTYAKDTGVMYLFYQSPATVIAKRQIHIFSDHPAIITTLAMNGSGPVQ